MVVATTFTDACESYLGVGEVLQRWTLGSIGSITNNDYSPPLGAFGNPSLLYVVPNATAQPGYLFTLRVKITGTPGFPVNLIRFMSGANVLGVLGMDAGRHLTLNNAAGTLSGSGPLTQTGTVENTLFHTIEVGWLVAASPNGKFEVRLDGTQVAELTTSGALGGSAAGSYNTGDGVHATIDRLELSGGSGLAQVIDFVILRSATVIWTNTGGATSTGDWFADPTRGPFYLKKKTVQLVGGLAGNGAYGPAGTPATTWVIGAGGPYFSDTLRSIPFDGDTSFLSIAALAGSGGANTVTSKFQTSPSDVGPLRTVTGVTSVRTTASGSQTKGFWYDPNTPPNNFSGPIETDSTAGYKHRLWLMDKHPDTVTTWTKALFDGSGSNVSEFGLQLVNITP